MTITFQIHYQTHWGQQLAISGSLPELGKGDPAAPLVMNYLGEGFWQASIPLKKAPASFEYQYVLLDEQGGVQPEGGNLRMARIPRNRERICLQDTWRSATHADTPFISSAFCDVIFKQKAVLKPSKTAQTGAGTTFRFQLAAARIPEGMQFALTGSLPELGEWNTANPLLLGNADFPVWTLEADLPASGSFEYKYGVYDPASKRWITYEQGPNRRWSSLEANEHPEYFVLSDEYFQSPWAPWKGAGVAIPVFSLRSEKSLGVGEFRDLQLMVDWAKKTGLRMLQVLPVNDTTVNYTWTDSYPYSAITVFALHPMFLALDAIPGAEKIIGKKALSDARKRLNQSPTVDYDEVINLKKSWGRKVFDAQSTAFLKSPAFQAFFEENRYWLEPYAVFCYLRDHYQTADFSQWKDHAVYHADLLTVLASPEAPSFQDIAFFYFQQFYLDEQLRQTTHYAREQGVVLKGDLPIGIYRHSVDAWVAPRLYNMDGQAGAPPDPFSENGQNWGFPTYKWEEMAKDNYRWWRDRMTHLSRYFDAYRIDHILGFFRIWEIPIDQVEGLMGRFRPALPVTLEEFPSRGIPFDEERFCRPFITQMLLEEWFNEEADWVRKTFLTETAFHQYAFKPEFDCQRKVEAFFEDPEMAGRKPLEKLIYRLFAEVLFFPEPGGATFHPRIDFQSTHSFRVLPHDLQNRLSALHHDYFYHRQESFWRQEAMEKLPALRKATEMLICGEDLGMVPACVPGVMREMGILSLEIQRMSKNPSTEFLQEQDIPYLSVTSTSTHDMSTIRGWWEESDRDQIRRFFHRELGMLGEPPLHCEPFVAQSIIRQHLEWPNMWTVFPLQDLLAMDGGLRRENPFDERINVPSNPKHYWRYRMHLTLEDLLNAVEFNDYLRAEIEKSGRLS